MLIVPAHTARFSCRPLVAVTMALVYLVILISPLAPSAAHSTGAPLRECTGDCNLCGCSPESRAANTCCCSKKRQQQAHAHEDDHDNTPDCCRKKPAEKKTVIACGCPCGSGKQAALSVSGSSEVLPFHFTDRCIIPHSDTIFPTPHQRLTSRVGEPPEHPPKSV